MYPVYIGGLYFFFCEARLRESQYNGLSYIEPNKPQCIELERGSIDARSGQLLGDISELTQLWQLDKKLDRRHVIKYQSTV